MSNQKPPNGWAPRYPVTVRVSNESRLYVSVSSLRGGLCRSGEAWAALVAEYLLTYLHWVHRNPTG